MIRPLRLLRRISSMSAREIATRLAQASGARIDAARHSLSMPPARPPLAANPPANGNFFFDPAAAPAMAALWKQTDPAAAASTIARAEQILTRRYPLLGYPEVDFGNPPDFQRDPVNNFRAPAVPFVSVPYLDFHAVGDHKVTWELSRHQHLVTLARAYLFTGDRRFADEAIAQFHHWCATNPYPLGVNWTSTLEVAFRILSWMWLDHLLAATPVSSPALRQEFAAHIGHGAWFIRRYLSTYFSPNTHLMGEAYALFAAGVVYRQFRDAPLWAAEGWRVVNEEAQKQIFADGFHFEQSTYYHVYSCDFFLHARMLASRNGLNTATLDAVIPRMATGLAAISQAGLTPRFGDDDGGRLFDPARNQTRHMLDPLATAAALYGKADWKALAAPNGVAGAPREETLWLLGAQGLANFNALPPAAPEPHSVLFPQSGYACLAQPAGLLVADAGPHGWGGAGHGHADALSVQLIACGQALLTDPGTGTYPFDTPARNRFRQTSAHSTLEIDGVGQAEPIGSFRWQTKPTVTVEHWNAGRRACVLIARHDGYLRLADPVVHRRTIVSLNDGSWLVHDHAAGQAAHSFRIHWQLGPAAEPVLRGSGWAIRYSSGQTLHIDAATQDESSSQQQAGWSWQTEPALWSPAYGAFEPALQLVYANASTPSAEVATLLSLGEHAPKLDLVGQGNSCSVYEWITGDGRHRVWIARQAGHWDFASLASDAAIIVASFNAQGSLMNLAVTAASQLTVNGRAVFKAATSIAWIEWSPGEPAPTPDWNPVPLAALA